MQSDKSSATKSKKTVEAERQTREIEEKNARLVQENAERETRVALREAKRNEVGELVKLAPGAEIDKKRQQALAELAELEKSLDFGASTLDEDAETIDVSPKPTVGAATSTLIKEADSSAATSSAADSTSTTTTASASDTADKGPTTLSTDDRALDGGGKHATPIDEVAVTTTSSVSASARTTTHGATTSRKSMAEAIAKLVYRFVYSGESTTLGDRWQIWLAQFRIALKAAKEVDEDVIKSTFLMRIGAEAFSFYQTLKKIGHYERVCRSSALVPAATHRLNIPVSVLKGTRHQRNNSTTSNSTKTRFHQVKLELDPTAQPVKQRLRPIAINLRDAVSKELDEQVREGILERITDASEPTP